MPVPAAPPVIPPTQIVPQLPPLPAGVSLNQAVTRVSVVPLIDSLAHIPTLREDEIAEVKAWMEVDRAYEARWRAAKEAMAEEARQAMYGWGKGGWWEKGGGEGIGPAAVAAAIEGNGNRWRRGREPFDVRYPRTRKDRDGRGRRGVKREGLKL